LIDANFCGVKMRALSVLSTLLALSGGIFLVIALLSAGASILSLIERRQHGPGLLFADVEFFGFIAFIFAVLGGLAVFGARKIARRQILKKGQTRS
jgi:hypothetical protein